MSPANPDIQTFSGQQRTADDLMRFVPPSAARVLDMHTGNSERGRLLKERGVEKRIGIMPRETLPDRDDPYTLSTAWYVDDWGLPEEEARDLDCVLLDEVIPRVRDYRGLLRELRTRVRDNALLVATLPNIQYHRCVTMVAEGHWQTADQGVLARPNIYLFTAVEGRNLINDCGFQTQRIVPLVQDPPEAFPREEDGYVRRDGYSVGPLRDNEYQSWLTEYYLFLATPV
jgi:hypothetical protein